MDPDVARLLDRLRAAAASPPGDPGPLDDLVAEEIVLSGGAVELLRPADRDALPFDRVAASAGDPAGSETAATEEWHPPHWARSWPSATALAVALEAEDLDDVRVLELGCGLGLPSLAAARAGARVLATDLSPAAVALTALNAERNGVRLAAEVADWAAPDRLLAAAPWDLVVGADVLYGWRAEHLLGELLPRLVAPGGAALLADPGREPAGRFLDAAGGWDVRSEPSAVSGVALHLLRPR